MDSSVGSFFVSFEGGEGSGKSTQAAILRERLAGQGIHTNFIHEPGSTPLGNYLREFLVRKPRLTKEAELLLFEASRAELVIREILPSLKQGIPVIADRFEASSIAYQGWGRRIDISVVEYLNEYATKGRYPDLTFLLEMDPEEALERIGKPQRSLQASDQDNSEVGRLDNEGARRFEDQPLAFHKRIRAGFLSLAKNDPERWVVIDASSTPETISEQIWNIVSERFDLLTFSE